MNCEAPSVAAEARKRPTATNPYAVLVPAVRRAGWSPEAYARALRLAVRDAVLANLRGER